VHDVRKQFGGSAVTAGQQPPSQSVQPTRPDAAQPARFKSRPAYQTSAFIAAIPWLVIFGIIVYQTDWPYLTDWLIAGSITTFVFFAADKIFAKTGGSRVPEGTLMGMVLLGGVIGGWLGMLIFRHKTAHKRFWAVHILASVIWIAAGVWYFILR
jgi:uncharacterized membrane protein YsdA (DUF1294 family)